MSDQLTQFPDLASRALGGSVSSANSPADACWRADTPSRPVSITP
jgi:hypothetical protein